MTITLFGGLPLPKKIKRLFKKPGIEPHLYTFGPGVPILGPELVVNGEFAADAVWDKGSGWAITGGKAVGSSASSDFAQYGIVVSGTTYKVTIDVAAITAGSLRVWCGAGGPSVTSAGKQSFTIKATDAYLAIQGQGGGFSGAIESIVIEPVIGYSNTYSGFVAGNYFDSAGTTHASVDGSVGAVLDAAGGVGAEISAGNDFTGWTGGSGWVFSGGKAVATAATGNASRLATVQAGKTYRVIVRCDTYTSGGFKLLYEGGQTLVGDKSSAGTFEANLYSNATGSLYIWVNSALTATFDYISVKEVTGIHATQSTPGYKPTLRRGIVNLLTWSNDLTNAAWSKANDSITLGFTDPDGGTTATRHVVVSGSVYQTVAVTPSSNYTFTFRAKNNGGGTVGYAIYNNTGAAFIVPVTSYEPQISEWATVLVQFSTPAGCSSIRVYPISSASCDVLLGKLALFQGTLTAAQILAAGGIPLTTTAPASSQAGPNYLEFKAANSTVLQLPSPAFQMADDHCVVVAATYAGGTATNNVIYSPAADSTASSIKRIGQIAYDATLSRIQGSWYDGTNYDELYFAWPSGSPFVAVTRKVGSTLELWVNGVLRMTKTATATAFTANCGTIGGYPTGGAASYFNGALYYADAIKGTTTVADVLLQSKLGAAAAGIQL